MAELLTTLNANSSTLTHLCLSAYLARPHSWDSAFQSPAIDHLTRLELVDTKISHYVLRRVMTCSERLTHLTLHGTFEDPRSAQVLFGADHVLEGRHTFLPYLESFRFLVMHHDDDMSLYQAVAQFVGQRKRLRRLDLGRCPWGLVAMVLPELEGLRTVRVRIERVVESVVDALTKGLSENILAFHLCAVVADKPIVRPLISLYCKSQIDVSFVGIIRKLLQEIPFTFDSPHEHHKRRCSRCEATAAKHVERERVPEGDRSVDERGEESRHSRS